MEAENPFSEKMEQLKDARLFEVLIRAKEYQPKAVEAARLEIEKRGIREEDYEEELTQILQSSEPLPDYWKVIFFLLPFGVFTWFMPAYYRRKGKYGKERAAWNYMKFGFVLYLLAYLIYFQTAEDPFGPNDIRYFLEGLFS